MARVPFPCSRSRAIRRTSFASCRCSGPRSRRPPSEGQRSLEHRSLEPATCRGCSTRSAPGALLEPPEVRPPAGRGRGRRAPLWARYVSPRTDRPFVPLPPRALLPPPVPRRRSRPARLSGPRRVSERTARRAPRTVCRRRGRRSLPPRFDDSTQLQARGRRVERSPRGRRGRRAPWCCSRGSPPVGGAVAPVLRRLSRCVPLFSESSHSWRLPSLAPTRPMRKAASVERGGDLASER